jgi:hypothetical protein
MRYIINASGSGPVFLPLGELVLISSFSVVSNQRLSQRDLSEYLALLIEECTDDRDIGTINYEYIILVLISHLEVIDKTS